MTAQARRVPLRPQKTQRTHSGAGRVETWPEDANAFVAMFLPAYWRSMADELAYYYHYTPQVIGAMRASDLLVWHDGLVHVTAQIAARANEGE